MSHCTTFAFSYADEATVVAACRRMGLTPVTSAVGEFSALSKALFARLGYAGGKQCRAICAQAGEYQLFVVREGDEYRLMIEKHGLDASDAQTVQELERRFRQAYVRSSLDGVVQALEDGGVRYEIQETRGEIEVRFGAELERSLRVRIKADNRVEEEVSGVVGNACEALTAEVEQLLSLSTTPLDTVWKQEHSINLEDEVLQVLRLQ
jgi:hypothetical protein